MKIVFFETKQEEKKYLEKMLKKAGSTNSEYIPEPLTNENIQNAKQAEIISVFIYSRITKEILEKLPKLKMIATRSTGYDHIDIKECKKRNITVCNVPFYGENTVAEHTMALILSLSRNVHKSYIRTLRNDFSIEGLSGFDLKGKTIGIIGGGHIGMHVARMAKGFGMHVRMFDIFKNQFLSEVIDFHYMDFDELLKNSDIISIHVPYNEKTHHLINRKTIEKMKTGAIIINTSRGSIVDTDALYEALKLKKIGGAGLDVIEGEDLIKEENELLHDPSNNDKIKMIVRNHEIFKMDNVVFTPHNAFNSKESIERILETTASNIEQFKNNNPSNQVK